MRRVVVAVFGVAAVVAGGTEIAAAMPSAPAHAVPSLVTQSMRTDGDLVPGTGTDLLVRVANPSSADVVVRAVRFGDVRASTRGCEVGVTAADLSGLALLVPASSAGTELRLPGALLLGAGTTPACRAARYTLDVALEGDPAN